MNIDRQLEQLSTLCYPKRVDVVGSVMARVSPTRSIGVRHRSHLWRYIASGAVAAALLLTVVNVAVSRSQAADEEQMSNMLSSVYDNSSYHCSGAIESVAEMDYLY